jgi:thiamine phosphate synthase YjbQ (UPF0047 family)
MKSHITYLKMNVPARMDFVNITGRVADAVRESSVREGLDLPFRYPCSFPGFPEPLRRF